MSKTREFFGAVNTESKKDTRSFFADVIERPVISRQGLDEQAQQEITAQRTGLPQEEVQKNWKLIQDKPEYTGFWREWLNQSVIGAEAMAKGFSKGLTFGALRDDDMQKNYPLESGIGEVIGGIGSIILTSKALAIAGIGALATKAGVSATKAIAPVAIRATPTVGRFLAQVPRFIPNALLSGSTIGTHSGVKEVVRQIDEGEVDAIGVGAEIVKGFGVGSLLGANKQVIGATRRVAIAGAIGYTSAKVGGASHEEALIQGGILGGFEAITGYKGNLRIQKQVASKLEDILTKTYSTKTGVPMNEARALVKINVNKVFSSGQFKGKTTEEIYKNMDVGKAELMYMKFFQGLQEAKTPQQAMAVMGIQGQDVAKTTTPAKPQATPQQVVASKTTPPVEPQQVKEIDLESVPEADRPLYKEALKYDSAEEFVESQDVKGIKEAWKSRGIKSSVSELDGVIELSKIIIPESERGKGLGTEAMQELLDYADLSGQVIGLTPDKTFGATSIKRLTDIYNKAQEMKEVSQPAQEEFFLEEPMETIDFDQPFEQVIQEPASVSISQDKPQGVYKKLQELELREAQREGVKEALREMQALKRMYKNAIKVPYGAERYYKERMPNYYKGDRVSYDVAIQDMQEMGVFIEGVESAEGLVDYFASLDNSIKSLREMNKQLSPNLITKKDITIAKNNVNKYEQGLRKGAVIERKQIEGYQSELIKTINELNLSAQDKTKFLTSIKRADTYDRLQEEKLKVFNRATALREAEVKRDYSAQIKKQLKTTKDVGGKGRYDIDTNRFFKEYRDLFKLNQEQAQEKLAQIGEPVNGYEAMKQRVLEYLANGSKSSVAMHEQVLQDIENMKNLGAMVKDQADMYKYLSRQAGVEEARELVGLRGEPNKYEEVVLENYLGGFGNLKSKLNAMFGKEFAEKHHIESLQTKTDTAKFGHFERFKKTAIDIYGLKASKLLTAEAKFLNMLGEYGKEDYKLYGDDVEHKISKADIMQIYTQLKNPTAKTKWYEAYGEGQVEELVGNLSQEDRMLADYMQEVAGSEDFYNVLNENHIRLYNKDLGRVENYFPSKAEHYVDVLDEYRQRSEIPTAEKQRVTKSIPLPANIFNMFNKHIAQVEHVRHITQPYEDLKRILVDRGVKNDIINKFGDRNYNDVLQTLDKASLNQEIKMVDSFSSLYGQALSNWVLAKIALNPSVFIKQLISVTNYSVNMPQKQWASVFMDGLSKPKETIDFMVKEHPFIKARYKKGYSEAISRALEEAKNISGTRYEVFQALSSLVRAGDVGAIIFGGYPKYVHDVEKFGKEKAKEIFMKETGETQQLGVSTSLSNLQNEKNPIVRGVLAFKNTSNQYFRQVSDAYISYQNGDIDLEKFGKIWANYMIIQPMLYTLAGALVGNALLRRNKEEEILGDVMQEIATAPLNAIPLIDDMAQAVTNRMRGKRNYQIFRTAMLSDIEVAMRKATKKTFTLEDFLSISSTAAEIGTGIPLKTAERYYKAYTKQPKRRR